MTALAWGHDRLDLMLLLGLLLLLGLTLMGLMLMGLTVLMVPISPPVLNGVMAINN